MLTTNENSHVVEIASGPLKTEYGEFKIRILHDGKEQCITAEMGDLKGATNVPCRMHSECICSHVFFSVECDCAKQMRAAMATIQKAGRGLIIFLAHEGRSNGAAAHIATQSLKRQGISQEDAYELVGFPKEGRDYRIAAKAIKYHEIGSVTLISASTVKRNALEALGVRTELRNDHFTVVPLGIPSIKLTQPPYTPMMSIPGKRKVLVIGDIAVDFSVTNDRPSSGIIDLPPMILGGTATNAAKAILGSDKLQPVVFGRIGKDAEGAFAERALRDAGIASLIGIAEEKRTGTCIMIYGADSNDRILLKNEANNANDYDVKELQQAVTISGLDQGDYVLVICHFFTRLSTDQAVAVLRAATGTTGARLILDLVPHNMYQRIDRNEFLKFCFIPKYAMIAEWITLQKLLQLPPSDSPDDALVAPLVEQLKSEWLILRYGGGNIEYESRYRSNGSVYNKVETIQTGYLTLAPSDRRGFGDKLTAELIEKSFLTQPT